MIKSKVKKPAIAKPPASTQRGEQKKQKRKETSATLRLQKKTETQKKTKVKSQPATGQSKAKKTKATPKKGKYYEAVGRRKTAIARVRLFTASPSQSVVEGNLIINNKPYKEFFPTLELQNTIEAPLKRLKSLNRFMVTVKVKGGGLSGQAGAVKHGLARALILFESNFRKKLKKAGFLTRDPRKKERKKYGLKKARRAPQWSKR